MHVTGTLRTVTATVLAAALVTACRPAATQDLSTPAAGEVPPAAEVTVAATSTTPMSDVPTKTTRAVIETSLGSITVALYDADAPKTVANFVKLAGEGFYDGTKFHRVIKDFMVQGGDPLSKMADQSRWGTGDPGYQFADEFNSHPLVRGSLAMANAGSDTNGSQFFIVTAESTPWLDGKHTNFGRVVEGMDTVERIAAVATGARDLPTTDIVVKRIRLLP